MREETLVKNLLQYQRPLEGMLFAMVGDAAVAEDLFHAGDARPRRRSVEAARDGAPAERRIRREAAGGKVRISGRP